MRTGAYRGFSPRSGGGTVGNVLVWILSLGNCNPTTKLANLFVEINKDNKIRQTNQIDSITWR